jgi:subtilisin family serine protease
MEIKFSSSNGTETINSEKKGSSPEPELPVIDQGDFYWADGQQIQLQQRATQISVILTQPSLSLDSLLSAGGPLEGFKTETTLAPNTYILETTTATPVDISQLKEDLAGIEGVEVAAVYQSPETNSWLVPTNEVIVALKPGVTPQQVLDNDPRFAGYRPLLGTPDQFIVTVKTDGDSLAIANDLQSDTNLQWASPNFYQQRQKFLTPNDPLYSNQWHLNNTGQVGGTPDADVDAPEAWDITPGGSSSVVIGVIDDGMQFNHPDLLVYTNPGEIANNGIDDDGNGWIDDVNGWDFTSGGIGDNNPGPSTVDDAHATSVAGVAAARGNNSLGVTGMAYQSKVLPVRIFLGANATTDANIASAIYYGAGRTANGLGSWNAGAILNNSWGGGGSSTAITNAFNWASTNGRAGKGVISFIATGNEFGSVSYPANLSDDISGVIAVGASTNLNQRASYSNYGPEVDFVAPSGGPTYGGTANIVTTDRTGADGYSPGDYTSTGSDGFSGTSSATPLAAGVGALILARNSNLTAFQLRGLMRNTTDLIGGVTYNSNGFNQQYGYGKVNANDAVRGVGIAEIQVLDSATNIPDNTGVVSFVAPVGGEQIKTLRVRNQGTSNLTLGSITFTPGSGFSLVSGFTDTTLSVGESATFAVRFAPTAPGTFTNSISFTNNDADEGTFNFSLNGTIGTPPTSNDNFADAFTLTGSSATATGSNLDATGESGEPNHAGVSSPLNSVWWKWTAPSSGPVTINTNGSNFDTTLAVYTGTSVSGLTEIAANDDSGSVQSSVTFTAVAGTNYKIAVDGYSSSVGNINLGLSQVQYGPQKYTIDDGTAEDSIGLTNGGDVMWFNQFNAVAGFETINSIAVAWGQIPANNQPTKLLIYEDPNDDGNPSDAVLLRQVDTTVLNPNTSQFRTVAVTPTTVSGSFFIAALFPNQLAGQFPAPIDLSNPISGRSWLVGSGAGQFNINNLGANSIPPLLIEDAGFPGNWLLRADSTGATLPTLSINDVSTTEGNSGTKTLTFTVTRTGTPTGPITVNYATADGTATIANNDYVATNSTLTFATTDVTKTINVTINGDTTVEPDENFFVNLSGASGATIADAQGVGTIVTDDSTLPTLSINDVSITEGNSGTKTLTFTVTRTGTPTGPITVNYATADGTATVANNDYVATNSTLTFATTDVTKTINVTINGDTNQEPNENFFVNLSNASGATIADNLGVGTITTDDPQTGLRQIITPNPLEYSVPAGGTVGVNVNYSTSDNDNTLPGIGFRLHYNSSDLTFNNFSNLFTTNLLAQGSPENDTGNFDNDPNTDKFINVAWLDFSGNWPNQPLPLRLYTANFTASPNFTDQTTINFSSGNPAAGYGFESTSAVINEGPAVNLDVDGNGVAQGSTDGLLIARFLFGFTGNTLINGAIGAGATRTTAAAIIDYLNLGMPNGSAPYDEMLDPDGNGVAQGSTDGLLIARYLFGFTGPSLINGAIGSGATRTTADAIQTFLGSFLPTPASISVNNSDLTQVFPELSTDLLSSNLLANTNTL